MDLISGNARTYPEPCRLQGAHSYDRLRAYPEVLKKKRVVIANIPG
jgi:hypothetical protein